MMSNLVKHLNTNSIVHNLQHCFREKRYCETQWVLIVEDQSYLQEGRSTD